MHLSTLGIITNVEDLYQYTVLYFTVGYSVHRGRPSIWRFLEDRQWFVVLRVVFEHISIHFWTQTSVY